MSGELSPELSPYEAELHAAIARAGAEITRLRSALSDLRDAYEEFGDDPGRCPYAQQTGDKKCDRGCYSEPSCLTDCPKEGWPSVTLLARVAELLNAGTTP